MMAGLGGGGGGGGVTSKPLDKPAGDVLLYLSSFGRVFP